MDREDAKAPIACDAPYAPSDVIESLTWGERIARFGGERAGDNWPMTWSTEDPLIYTAYGDGNGFAPRKACYTLAFAMLQGVPPVIRATDMLTSIDTPVGWGKDGIKASGLLMVGDVLYLLVRNYEVDGDWRNARLAWSEDLGRTWVWADWWFSESFGCPEFVQFGPAYAGARDNYVYIASQDGNSAYDFDSDIVLARVPKFLVPERSQYEFYAGLDENGAPVWAADIADRKAIFTDPRGTQRIAITYNRGIERYLLTTAHDDGSGATHTPALGVFDAPNPWGPWTTVTYDDAWADGWMIHHKFPTPWMSDDGTTMWLAFSGQYVPGGKDYCLLTRRATLRLKADG
jgi:hypothetical protein